ncbi:MAG TPA: reactive intermediate/imine deaminase [Ruminococcaceae bacterium]|jgi:2-iminobutanoate/2-iminopropanoate deaminase|nr:RidA family protein [Oscillospiraceae bacterium]HCA71247.1 reactive intermediate/imine deaminase [Oscillospiraceae bacterium]HCC02930.1 reactive intermediate/imine deaminase [Oscillospiraceae bacterium]HCM23433.1 reactive intermediate/imine deaminase [Oscillospiraceae bacterium]
MNEVISAKNAPSAVGPYSHAIKAGNTLYLSGQLGLDPISGELPVGVEAQARQSLKNIGAVLAAADMSYADVVKTTVFLADIQDFAAINAIYGEYFKTACPARSCMQVAALPKNALFEMEAVAVKG